MATSSVSVQMANLLDEYSEEVQKVVEEAGKEAAKECAAQLRSTSPKRKGDYAASWRYKKNGKSYVVYNAKHYQLTHLLENGHIIRNKYGTYGRAPAIKHIKPVEQSGISDFEMRISRGLS